MKVGLTASGLMAAGLAVAAMLPSAGATRQVWRTSRARAARQYSGKGTIGGQVLGTDGKVVAGARVTLQSGDGKHPETTLTNTEGRFWFPSLSSGLYDVRAYAKGRVSEWRHNVWVDPGKQSNVTLRLRSGKPAPEKSAPAPAKP